MCVGVSGVVVYSEDDVTAHLDELRLPQPPIVVQNNDGYLIRKYQSVISL